MSAGARRTLFWISLILAVVVFLSLFSDIMFPFVAGLVLAYCFNPFAVRITKLGVSRSVAATLALSMCVLAVGLLILLILPILQQQLASLLVHLPLVVERTGASLSELAAGNSFALSIGDMTLGEEALSGLLTRILAWLLQSLNSVWQSGSALFNFLGLIVVTPVITWYLLRDWERLIEKCDNWLPRDYAATIRCQIALIDQTLAHYLRGQASVCLILAGGYSLALELVGLEHGLAIGLISGVISFIPYLGAVVGIILAGGLAYVQYGTIEFVGVVFVVFLIGQIMEGYILTPRLVGDRIGLNTVWVLFALLAGGKLFGFVGVLLAIPAAAIIGVLCRFALHRYLGSHLYIGSDGDDREARE